MAKLSPMNTEPPLLMDQLQLFPQAAHHGTAFLLHKPGLFSLMVHMILNGLPPPQMVKLSLTEPALSLTVQLLLYHLIPLHGLPPLVPGAWRLMELLMWNGLPLKPTALELTLSLTEPHLFQASLIPSHLQTPTSTLSPHQQPGSPLLMDQPLMNGYLIPLLTEHLLIRKVLLPLSVLPHHHSLPLQVYQSQLLMERLSIPGPP